MKEIVDCGKDTKNYNELMNNKTGSASINQMSEGMNSQELEESFADYFH